MTYYFIIFIFTEDHLKTLVTTNGSIASRSYQNLRSYPKVLVQEEKRDRDVDPILPLKEALAREKVTVNSS